jgi:hypothetical protein
VAGRALQRLCAGVETSRVAQARKLVVELERFQKKHAGTLAAKQAEEMIAQLRK